MYRRNDQQLQNKRNTIANVSTGLFIHHEVHLDEYSDTSKVIK